ncbi:MAG: 3-oxoacyl-ACP reductase FabG [Candidatus Velthaea sp.]
MFEGKVAIVTGGTRGIGAGITRHLARNGIRVGAGYSRGEKAAEALRAELAADASAAPISLHCGQIDHPADCERVVSEVLATHGRVDYLINNAGITIDKTLRKMTVDDWHRVLNVNLFGSFCMIKAVVEHMIERGSGRIVNISSLTGQTGNVGQSNYAASKAGLFGLTMSLALELARRGITVNAIAPGFIDTEMAAAVPAAQLEKYIERIPMRRMGTPDEVGHLVKFLLEDDSGYITGATYSVAGGLDLGW